MSPRFLVLCIALVLEPITATCAWESSGEPTLWYLKPAPVWSEALPIGNGRIGAMVFGGANTGQNNGDSQTVDTIRDLLSGDKTRGQDEHLQLNESTLWEGSRENRLNPAAHDGFLKVRALLLASQGTDAAAITEAEKIADKTMLPTPRGMPGYSTLGDLTLRSTEAGTVTHYRRQLNLATGEVDVSFDCGGVHVTREILSSAIDHVIVVHVAADHAGALSYTVALDRPQDASVRILGTHDLVLTEGPGHKDQIHFHAQVRVAATGGTVSATDTGLAITQADDLVLYIAAATDYAGLDSAPRSPAAACATVLDAATAKGWAGVRAAAIADQRRFMERTGLQLGATDPALEGLPTDERLRRVARGETDLGLQALYFAYARYLLVGSSRPGGLPATLQGLWASGISNPWGSKWTINVNTEMNYWLAEAAGLGDLQAPLVALVERVRRPETGTGEAVARSYYGARGFVIHHNTDLWGDAEPIDGVPYGIWPMGGAWLTLHAWDHYAFTGDAVFLRDHAWPLLRDSARFFLDYLVDDGHGHLVTGPSLSPENRYLLADGTSHSLAMGPTMDIEIVRELFERTIQAGAVLGTNPAFCAEVQKAMDRLPGFKVGRFGNLQEWQTDYAESAVGHRHISHLWALFPGTQISLEHTPDLAKAARITLERRLQAGGGQTGWSRAWVVNYWDHLGEGEKAYESLQVLFRQSTFPNLMDTHPPGVFQIDGNLGAANGMLEALIQSRWYPDHGEVDLLPALPSAWSQGSVHGARVRGGADVTFAWHAGKLTAVTWRAAQTGTVYVRLPPGQRLVTVKAGGQALPLTSREDGSTALRLNGGTSYAFQLSR